MVPPAPSSATTPTAEPRTAATHAAAPGSALGTGKAQATITAVVFSVWLLFAVALMVVLVRRRRSGLNSADHTDQVMIVPGGSSARRVGRASKHTLTAPQLAQLPAVAFSDHFGTVSSRASGADSEKPEVAIDVPACVICLEDFEDTSLVRALACSHVFHADCIDRWLLKRSCRCPLCNADTRGGPGMPRKPSSVKLAA
ncbi:E3 ubiquitin-protein ligase rnf38 [Coemansia javaensis]|uniref:E3 ubiquitin-protein ligase rnf38 n=1 Tax=Coemansia javaensis TaxID=2761396 RepID=A0A9W8LME1_9FUNG|nr:E3 ubiquitin-protein ligase rnf38 [Coemansia javaensis]